MNYSLSQIAKICRGRLVGSDHTVDSIITDSRSVSQTHGALFVAMRGARHDSHIYIEEMSRRGVMCFMCEREVEVDNISYIVVENAIEALQQLATHHRSTLTAHVVAITGSNGKTTIKEWIAQSTPHSVKLSRSPRSYNSQLGVALSLLMCSGWEDVVVIEAGVSQSGEMAKLERMIYPDTVIFSSIGDAHNEGFQDITHKIKEKLILSKRAQQVIFHSDYPNIAKQLPKTEIEIIDASKFKGAEFADIASRRNSQIVEAFCAVMHYPTPAFETLHPVAMRLELREGINNSIILNDSYNCDINSLSIAIDRLMSVASGRKTTLILSDILQSGVSKEELYRRVATTVEGAGIDTIIGVGAEISSCSEMFGCNKRLFGSTQELLSSLSREDYADRAILLKGNRESRFETISHRLSYKSHTTTLEVDLDAMIDNLNYFRSLIKPTTKLTAMVKALSYGAGDVEIAQVLQHQGVDYLAVAFADEGQRLREGGVTMPIIVLNADDGSFAQMIDFHLEPEIYSLNSLRAFAAEVQQHGERSYPIHIKLDTGMHRLGFEPTQIEQLKEFGKVLRVASIFSHLSSSDTPAQDAKTHAQAKLFFETCKRVEETLGYGVVKHLCNSAGMVRFPEYQGDMCRLGIGLYGFGEGEGLRPISSLKSRIVQIKEHTKDSPIGYCESQRLTTDSRIATIPIGYADGLNRHLGNCAWSVMIRGEKAPIVGRICMDSCMVDITHIEETQEGDEVVIFSSTEGNTAQDIADVLQTIPYEVLTSVSSRVKRIYLKE